MHSALKISWIAFAVINIWVHAAARDIHVSHSAPDGGDGARERPLRTLDSALRVAEPGDVVCLAEGVYREGNLRFYRGGTSEKRLTVQANADAKVVITGSTVVTGWRQSDNGAWRRESWDTDSQQLFCDGEPLKQIGAANSFTTLDGGDGNPCLKPTGSSVDDLTSGSFSYDSASKKLFCRLRDDADPNQYLMEASVEPGILDGGDSSF
ncbi:MAG TPA: chondroitinase-B domain-containing protein, partial [Tepidisphaeraceae bacterium]|nr:chondroitinase-B domain-containing protein [Tepidisphaeraceae bacterium]